MKMYQLHPEDRCSWLKPADVFARLSSNFPHVTIDAKHAEELGRKQIATYKRILEAGLGDDNSAPLEAVEKRWLGALYIDIWIDENGDQRFSILAQVDTPLVLVFGYDVSARRYRSLANRASKALGYTIVSIDND